MNNLAENTEMKTEEFNFVDEKLDLERLKEFLRYDPISGELIWIKAKASARPGDKAGTVSIRGYRQIKFDSVIYHEHRLAWLLFWNTASPERIFHLDGDHQNNRIDNLAMECEVRQAKNLSASPKPVASNVIPLVPKATIELQKASLEPSDKDLQLEATLAVANSILNLGEAILAVGKILRDKNSA